MAAVSGDGLCPSPLPNFLSSSFSSLVAPTRENTLAECVQRSKYQFAAIRNLRRPMLQGFRLRFPFLFLYIINPALVNILIIYYIWVHSKAYTGINHLPGFL